MTWLVFAVSCLLVLAGAVSIISGAPIIQIERGWAEVIAGAVALSSGGVVFALAAILVRLESVRRAIAESAQSAPPITVQSAVQEGAVFGLDEFRQPEPRPTPIAVDSVLTASAMQAVEPESPTEEGEERHGLWKRVRRPSEAGSQSVGMEPSLAPPVNEPALTEPVLFPAQEALPQAPTVSFEPTAELSNVTVTSVEGDQIGATENGNKTDGSLSWLDRSLFRSRLTQSRSVRGDERAEPTTDDLTPAPRDQGSSHRQPDIEADSRSVSDHSTRHPDHPAAIQDPGESPVDPQPAEASPTDEVTVIGRYQAGVASYVMYSDGTIEVETQGGELHRFGSMEELKAYIAQQDTSVS